MYRIDLTTALDETYGARMKTVASLRRFAAERTVEMTLGFMANLVKAGVDAFDVDLGCYDNWWLPHRRPSCRPAALSRWPGSRASTCDQHGVTSNAGLEVPVAAVGKLGNPDLCEQALRDEACDLVMLGRPLLCDPDWPLKAYAGRIDEIVPCIGDQEGCVNEFVEGGHPQCAVNPRTGFEDVFAPELPIVARPRRVAVVGAGPSGIACACAAARAATGSPCSSAEERPGGMLVPGSVPRAKLDVANYLRYLEGSLQRIARRARPGAAAGHRGVGRAARAGGLRHCRDLHRRRARAAPDRRHRRPARGVGRRSVAPPPPCRRRPAGGGGRRRRGRLRDPPSGSPRSTPSR